MKAIKFTNGTLLFDGEYYTLELFNNGKKVYRSTETKQSASEIMLKHKNIVIL